MQTPKNFEQRALEYRYNLAAELAGTSISPEQFREITGKKDQKKSTYHMRYSPRDIRTVRNLVNPTFFETLAKREIPALITCHTSKGGTGKTTLSTNLAVALAAQGYRVALIDADPQASATTLMGFQEEDPERLTLSDMLIQGRPPEDVAISIYSNADLDFFPADLRMCKLDRELAVIRNRDLAMHEYIYDHRESLSKYEFIIFDTNPSSTLLNFNVMVPAHLILTVAVLDGLSITALHTLTADLEDIEQIRKRQPSVLLVANRFHPSFAHVKDNLALLRQQFAEYLAQTVIPDYAGFGRQVKIGLASKPLIEAEPTSPGATAIFELSREVAAQFNPALSPHKAAASQ